MGKSKLIAIIILLIMIVSLFMPTIVLAVDEIENQTENNTIIEENGENKDNEKLEDDSTENDENIQNEENVQDEEMNDDESIDNKKTEENNENTVNENEVVYEEANEEITVNQDEINNINQEIVMEQDIEEINEEDVKVKYSSHIQDYGWETEFSKVDGQVSGTQGQNKRIEAIKVALGKSEEIPEILFCQ